MRRQNPEQVNTGPHFDYLYSSARRAEIQAYAPLWTLLTAVVRAGKVLDVGCGWGQYFPYLAANGASYTGIDFSAAAIREGKLAHPDANWIRGDFAKRLTYSSGFDLADSYFDYVVCLETLEHLDEPAALVAEIHRVLAPDGLAVLSTPFEDRIVCPEHCWEFSADDWPALLGAFASHTVFRYSNGAPEPWEHFLVLARK